MHGITPFLWFDDNAEEAIEFYTSIFPDSAITSMQRQGEDGPLFMATVRLAGQDLMILNGGPHYQLSPAFSLFVSCEDQAEVDRYWGLLTEGGEESMCGWLVDRFGLSWQVIPAALGEYLGDPDAERRQRATEAMLSMRKIDLEGIRRAAEGE
jgi:predicted 3-demethylubiquinone-9 3-methyltransferase (glyoxalase superfamily)